MTSAGRDKPAPLARAATRAAEEALLDRRVFRLDAPQPEAFERTLDAPPRSLPALGKLLARPAPWER